MNSMCCNHPIWLRPDCTSHQQHHISERKHNPEESQKITVTAKSRKIEFGRGVMRSDMKFMLYSRTNNGDCLLKWLKIQPFVGMGVPTKYYEYECNLHNLYKAQSFWRELGRWLRVNDGEPCVFPWHLPAFFAPEKKRPVKNTPCDPSAWSKACSQGGFPFVTSEQFVMRVI